MNFFTELERLPLIAKICRWCGTIYVSYDIKGTKYDILPNNVCCDCLIKLEEER